MSRLNELVPTQLTRKFFTGDWSRRLHSTRGSPHQSSCSTEAPAIYVGGGRGKVSTLRRLQSVRARRPLGESDASAPLAACFVDTDPYSRAALMLTAKLSEHDMEIAWEPQSATRLS